MGFTSLVFFLFLAGVLAGFLALPGRWRPAWLLLGSAGFAASYGIGSFLHLVAVVAVAHLSALRAGAGATPAARARAVWLGVAVLVSGLAISKFGDAALAELARLTGTPALRTGLTPPPGFSFYVFMAIAHVVDVGRGLHAPAGLLRTALQLAWFPKLLAGPIERAGHLLPQLGAAMRANPGQTALGLQLILWGLVKKVVIAENLAPVVDGAFAIPAYAPPLELLIALYFFAFQLYCDFSGYSDMGIGLSLLFGIALRENFRRPFLSLTVAEFWSRRWHISLGTWFRDYLFFPLTGSRGAGALRQHLALLSVFAVSGLWHAGQGHGIGWGFLAWGLLNGLYVSVERLLQPAGRSFAARFPGIAGHRATAALRAVLTFHLILVTWAFFRAATLSDALVILRRIAGGLAEIPGLISRYPFGFDHALGAGLIGALVLADLVAERRPILERVAGWPRPLRWGLWYAGLAALLLLGRWGESAFIYMAF